MKSLLRMHFLSIRDGLSEGRKKSASISANEYLSQVYSKKNVLSFAPKNSEINIWDFNDVLFDENRCFLPKVSNSKLEIYHVKSRSYLKLSPFQIWEPDPKTCKRVDLDIIDCILVPAIAFDQKQYRLGWGKGYYDRLLSTCNKMNTLGIGFREQLTKNLPVEAHDHPVHHLSLF